MATFSTQRGFDSGDDDAAAVSREFVFETREFERVRDLIYRRAGIVLATGKEDMVYGRLARRLRALRLHSFREYLSMLDNPDNDEWEHFTNALTTNLTSFFREAHHFDILREHLKNVSPRELRVWSSASSTGEEPYSIAMVLAEVYGSQSGAKVIATDLDTHVLAQAEAGIYPIDRLSQMPVERVKRFFRKGTGPNQGLCRVNDEIRAMVEFDQLNLIEPNWQLRGGFEVIFCRNVMIYFDKPTQLAILERMLPLLNRDGLFFAGHSESYFHAGHLIRSVGRTVYRKAESRA
jgi:chemotaxis protein methyltransferase CheR